jgi:hypothetical protein
LNTSQPIFSAPKDERVVVWYQDDWTAGFYDSMRGRWYIEGRGFVSDSPTRWLRPGAPT